MSDLVGVRDSLDLEETKEVANYDVAFSQESFATLKNDGSLDMDDLVETYDPLDVNKTREGASYSLGSSDSSNYSTTSVRSRKRSKRRPKSSNQDTQSASEWKLKDNTGQDTYDFEIRLTVNVTALS